MRFMRRRWPLLLLCLLWLQGRQFASAEGGESVSSTYRTGTEEVRLLFVATDQDGHNRASLSASDFAVVDNGYVIRDFRSFHRLADSKLDLLVLIDASESVATRFRREQGDVLSLLASSTWGPDDWVSVMWFGGEESTSVCLRNCRSLPPATLFSAVRAGGLTPLYDSLALALQQLGKRSTPQNRPVVVVISDGQDTISIRSEAEVVAAAQRAEVPIYTIDINGGKSGAAGSFALRRMADATGGRNLSLEAGAPQALSALLEDLQATYLATYTPPYRNFGTHAVRILPTRDLKLRFRSRQAYYYDTGQPAGGTP
jgi:VWFA-related protein